MKKEGVVQSVGDETEVLTVFDATGSLAFGAFADDALNPRLEDVLLQFAVVHNHGEAHKPLAFAPGQHEEVAEAAV